MNIHWRSDIESYQRHKIYKQVCEDNALRENR